MTAISEWVSVSQDEEPFVNFEASLDSDTVVSGYIPVKSTLDVFDFLKEATATSSPRGRAVICHGTYGTGKSRMCALLARLLRDGFDCPALQPVWKRLEARGQLTNLQDLRHTMLPAGRPWRKWLVVPMYAGGEAGTLSAALIRSLAKALRRAGVDDSVLGQTIYHAAARRLDEIIGGGHPYQASADSPFGTAAQLRRALEQDFDEHALNVFREFYKRVTVGLSFDLTHISASAFRPEDVFRTVSERIQRHGFEGIAVIWDEFGFALEELLRGADQGLRSLGQEIMDLQQFVENACRSNDLGRKVIFLGFTHVSLTEYGTRAGLDETDRNRISTVSGRFRNPSIFVRLSVTETEGYHLLSGMIQRTPAGSAALCVPSPRMQRIAERMPKYQLWRNLSAATCCEDVVAPCYPFHPAAAATLLQLSDKIAQVNRTTFYYLQDVSEGGFAGSLSSCQAPDPDSIGSTELVRVNHLLHFFEQSIKESRRPLYEQYEDAIARFPNAEPLDVAILQTVLILSVITNSEMAPTTSFVTFCLADVLSEEAAANSVHESLKRLANAHSLWKNEATEVWGFGGERGLSSGMDKLLEQELAEIPPSLSTLELVQRYPHIQQELTDRLGDHDLDPADTGIVRTITIEILDSAKGDKAVDTRGSVGEDGAGKWRAARVYLVCEESQAQLDSWKTRAATLGSGRIYFLFPASPLTLSRDKLRDLIAVQNAIAKSDPEAHAARQLEARQLVLRRELRARFDAAFGNSGLRAGTQVIRATAPQEIVQANSWNALCDAIDKRLNEECKHQLKVRCGTYNEWQSASKWSPIQDLVEKILQFDGSVPFQSDYMGFKETSQEAAIVDGVLRENRLFYMDPIAGKWQLVEPSADTAPESLKETLRHFQTGGSTDKEFSKLFARLIEPPFSVPNGIIPILTALVFRSDPAKLCIYQRSGSSLQRVTESDLPAAIVQMARHPDRFTTRYTKLAGKQRFVFKAIGPECGVTYTERLSSGERFYEYCEQVRTALRGWAATLPESVLTLTDLTDNQRRLLKSLRGAVPSQLPLLADQLLAVVQDAPETLEEVCDAGSRLTAFPNTTKLWRDLRTRIGRHIEGVKAPLRIAIREISQGASRGGESEAEKIAGAIRPLERIAANNPMVKGICDRLKVSSEGGDIVDKVASAIAHKPSTNLTSEDFVRAHTLLQFASSFRVDDEVPTILMPDGAKWLLSDVTHTDAANDFRNAVSKCLDDYRLTKENVLRIVLDIVSDASSPPDTSDAQTDVSSEQSGADASAATHS